MKKLFFIACSSFCFSLLLHAQVPGDIENIRFEYMDKPVQSSTGGDPINFIHATYVNAAWGDYNNNGTLDLFYSDKNNHGSATKIQSNFYQNNGDGTFRKLTSPFAGVAFSCPVWFDMNNDGLLDLFLPGLGDWYYQWNDLDTRLSNIQARLYINQGVQDNGTCKFKEMPVAESGLMPVFNGKTGGKGHNWAVAGDYDNDGYTDLLVTGFDEHTRVNREDYEDAVRAVYLFKNIKGEYFELQKTPLEGAKPFHGLTDGSVCFVDLDNDGWLDIVSTGYGYSRESEVHVYWNQQNGTFKESDFKFDTTCNSSCDVYDLNNDGLADIIMTGVYFNNNQKQFYIYKNKGERNFEKIENENLLPIDGGQLSFGDVNHDGLPDMLVGGHNNTHQHSTWLYVNKGDFDFEPIAWYNQDDYGWAFPRVTHGNEHLIDIDNDGLLDAWISGWSNGACSSGCDTQLWKNTSVAGKNEAPGMPQNLRAKLIEGSDILSLAWEEAADDVTPQKALRYNVYLKKKEGDKCCMTVPADITSGFIKVGSVSGYLTQCSYKIKVESDGEYEWGVQAIDNGGRGGLFAKATVKVDGTTGITTLKEEDAILISSNGQSLNYSISGMGKMTVFGIDGSVTYQSRIHGTGTVNLMGKGTYIVRIETDSAVKRQKVLMM